MADLAINVQSGKHREAAECVIRVGGSEIADLYPYVSEVTVDADHNKPAVATLRFDTRRDEQGKWITQDDQRLTPWQPIVIEAAFGNATEEVMRGYIRQVQADYPRYQGQASVTVECRDSSLALDREHVRKVWGADVPAADQAIVAEIASKYGLSPDPLNGTGQTGLTINQDGTDIDFLQRRARANGYDLLFREDKVYFGPMRFDAASQPTIMVYAGEDTHCIRLDIRDDGHQPDQVTYDRADAQVADNASNTVTPDLPLLGNTPADSSGRGLPDFAWRMSRDGGMSDAEWEARAQRKANELSLKVEADGEMDGSLYGHVLRVGEPVGVDGVGERHSGAYFVGAVRHRFNAEGYRQAFTLYRNAYGDNLGAGGGGILDSVLGG